MAVNQRGSKSKASYALTDNFSLRGAYTYTKTEDANGDKFYGVPEHQIGVNANYRMMGLFECTCRPHRAQQRRYSLV